MYIDIDQVGISKFIGAIEHCWDSNGAPFHELSLIFSAHIENISSAAEVISRESHLKFYWIKLDELTNINLLPSGISNFLLNYEKQEDARFFTTMK